MPTDKKNAQKNNEVVEQAADGNTAVVKEPGGTPTTEPTDTKETTPPVGETIVDKSESETGGSEPKDNTKDTQVDTKTKGKGTGKKTGTETDVEASEKGKDVKVESKKDKERSKIADDVFAKNARCKVLYFTSDMVPFFDRSDANKHASHLKDDTVVTLNKE